MIDVTSSPGRFSRTLSRLGRTVSQLSCVTLIAGSLVAAGCAVGESAEYDEQATAVETEDRAAAFLDDYSENGLVAIAFHQDLIEEMQGIEFTEAERSVIQTFEREQLAAHGLTFQDVAANPASYYEQFQQDPGFRTILLKTQEAMGIEVPEPGENQSKRLAPVAVALIAGAVAVVVLLAWYGIHDYYFTKNTNLIHAQGVEYCQICRSDAAAQCNPLGAAGLAECVSDGGFSLSAGGGLAPTGEQGDGGYGGTVSIDATQVGSGRACAIECQWPPQ